MPEQQAPQLATLVEAPPAGDEWVSEIKFDGYRILADIDGDAVRLLTRNGLDWAPRMPALAAAFKTLGVRRARLDGELVALRDDGVSSFPGLQSALKAGRDDTLVYSAFDLLHLDGWDLRPCTLLDRKSLLQALPLRGALRFSEHVTGAAAAMHANAGRLGLEGIICKRAAAPYRAGRGGDWLKVKCLNREEFVVLGWTPPAGSRVGFGALHLGYHGPDGALHYSGGVGSGFDAKDLVSLHKRLLTMAAPTAGHARLGRSGGPLGHLGPPRSGRSRRSSPAGPGRAGSATGCSWVSATTSRRGTWCARSRTRTPNAPPSSPAAARPGAAGTARFRHCQSPRWSRHSRPAWPRPPAS